MKSGNTGYKHCAEMILVSETTACRQLVDIWAYSSLSAYKLDLEDKLSSIEVSSICFLSFVHLICVYIPPIVAENRSCRDEILRFHTETVDKIRLHSQVHDQRL